VLTATGVATGAPGIYTVDVTQLAKRAVAGRAGVSNAKAAVGKGTVTIDFGTISGGTLNAATGTLQRRVLRADAARAAKSIVIDDSNNSLEGLRDAINAKTDIGVTAAIVNDGGASPYRLVLTSKDTGAASSMRISVSGDAGLQPCSTTTPPARRPCSRRRGLQCAAHGQRHGRDLQNQHGDRTPRPA
jgi:flagellar hook-associated protein 2